MDWFRLYHEFATDPKVQSMPEAMQRRLIMLMCLRCSNVLETLQEQDICFALRITETDLMETKSLFIAKHFINERWEILQWDKRQKPSDSSTERVRKHREAQKQLQEQDRNVTETAQSREDKKRKDKSTSAPRFDAQAHLESLGVESNVARDWLTLRSGKKLKPTETAFSGVVKQAQKAGLSMNDVLILCCTRGWGGFEASWVEASSGGKSQSQQLRQEKYL